MAKQVTCCICNETVNKAQTLSLGGEKRACRKHPETNQQAESAQQTLKNEAQKRAEAEHERKNAWRKNRRVDEAPSDLQPRCFCCKRKGLRQDNYFLEMLKCGERYEMQYGKAVNPFNQEENKIAYSSLADKQCLWIIPFDQNVKMEYNAFQAAKILGFSALCSDCCEKHNIPYGIKELPSIGSLLDSYDVYESHIKPVIRQEIAKESKLN
jgi:hypothetical protein